MNDNTENNVWTKRNVCEEPRLSELKDLYEELGFEVKIENCSDEDFQDDGCNECIKANADKYKVIYTKPKSE